MPPNEQLISFIVNAFNKGYQEDFIRQGLLQKGWPIQTVQESITEAKKRLPQKQEEPSQKVEVTQEKIKEIQGEVTTVKLKKTNLTKTISLTSLSFLGIFLILSFTFVVFEYMQNIREYTVTNPQTGEVLKKTCYNPDCSDMRDYANDQTIKKIKEKNIFNPLVMGFLLALLLVIIYELVSFKKLFFWISNIIYFIFIVVIAVVWISFSSSP